MPWSRRLRVANAPDRAQGLDLASLRLTARSRRDGSVDRVARRLRMEGTGAVRSELLSRFDNALERGSATTAQLDVRRDRVVVDVTHTLSNSLHTGIQRVVRETVSRWIDAGFRLISSTSTSRAGSLRTSLTVASTSA